VLACVFLGRALAELADRDDVDRLLESLAVWPRRKSGHVPLRFESLHETDRARLAYGDAVALGVTRPS